MNRQSLYRACLILVFTGATLFLYNNCAGGLPDEVNNPGSSSNNSVISPDSVLAPLSANVTPSSIYTDESAQVNVAGGLSPYTYAVTSGTAAVSASGRLSGSFSVGSILVRVTDGAGQTVTLALTTSTRPSTPSTPTTPAPTYASCASPFGGTIAHGASITAFQTSTIVCPSTATCASQVRTCNNGTLSGTYTAASCSTRACVYKLTHYANDQSAGNSICGGSYQGGDNGGINYSVPVINYASQLPASCTPMQYNSAKFCEIGSSGGGGDNGYTYYFNLYTCRGADEAVTPVYVAPMNQGGN